MTKLSVGAPVLLLLLSPLPAHAVQPIPVEPARVDTDQGETPAASDPNGGKVSPEVRARELAELKAANAAQLESSRQQIDANTRSREEFERADAEYRKQLEAANAAKAQYDADMAIYHKRVAACEAGDRRGCEGR